MGLMLVLSACQEAPRQAAFIDLGAVSEEPPPEPEPEVPTRPSNAIFFKNDFCACNNSKPVIISGTSCVNFCAGKNTNNTDTLYFGFTIGSELPAAGLENVSQWCKKAIGESTNPSCVLTVKSTAGDEPLITFDFSKEGNNFSANISALAYDKTYIITLKEPSSGAVSDSIQLRKISDNTPSPLGPLWTQPITQYTCMNIQAADDGQYLSAIRLNYYFIERFRPDPLPAGITNIYCHDVFSNGPNDSSTYPRLEETAGALALWSAEDPRFYDRDSSGQIEINEIIFNKIKSYGGNLAAPESYFFIMKNPSGPSVPELGINASTVDIGYLMRYFFDNTGSYAYCPTQAHYNSNDPRLKAIGDVVQVDTEGVYYGCRENLTYRDVNNEVQPLVGNVLTLRESDLKKVWFYFDPVTKQPTEPKSVSALRNNLIKFYYPFDFNTPYIRKSHQHEYTIRDALYVSQKKCDPSASGGSPSTSNSTSTQIPHDKRLGCIPKSN